MGSEHPDGGWRLACHEIASTLCMYLVQLYVFGTLCMYLVQLYVLSIPIAFFKYSDLLTTVPNMYDQGGWEGNDMYSPVVSKGQHKWLVHL